MTTKTIPDRLDWDLTPENLAGAGLDPLYPGEYISYRHQALDIDGAAISLAGAVLVMSVRKKDSLLPGDLWFKRRSLDDIGGGWTPTTKQIVVDANQAVEDAVAGTGKGWWTMTFAPTDETTLTDAIGRWYYDVRAKFVDNKVRTLLRGRIAIPYPRTITSAFAP
jgi:hypothetical protein